VGGLKSSCSLGAGLIMVPWGCCQVEEQGRCKPSCPRCSCHELVGAEEWQGYGIDAQARRKPTGSGICQEGDFRRRFGFYHRAARARVPLRWRLPTLLNECPTGRRITQRGAGCTNWRHDEDISRL
jgi:hypothetical protein